MAPHGDPLPPEGDLTPISGEPDSSGRRSRARGEGPRPGATQTGTGCGSGASGDLTRTCSAGGPSRRTTRSCTRRRRRFAWPSSRSPLVWPPRGRRTRRLRRSPPPTTRWRPAWTTRPAYLAADLEFHGGILLGSFNDELLEHLGRVLRAVLRATFALTTTPSRSRRRALPLHRAILDGILAGDEDAAEAAAKTLIADTAAASEARARQRPPALTAAGGAVGRARGLRPAPSSSSRVRPSVPRACFPAVVP